MSVNSISNPKWPAWAHDHRWAWRLDNLDPFRIITQDYLQQGSLFSVHILDSNLNLFKIVDVLELRRAGIFGWRPGFKGTYLRVEPTLQFEHRLSLEMAKKYVLDFLLAHPKIYKSGMSIKELSAAINAASSSEELLNSL